MNIYDIEFELVGGLKGRAIAKAESAKEARETLQLKILVKGFQMDGGDVFDIVETGLLEGEDPEAIIIGVNTPTDDREGIVVGLVDYSNDTIKQGVT
jgi:hypothetical protein